MSQWINTLLGINTEIDYLKKIESNLIKDNNISTEIQSLRRKNTLLVGTLCKYEKELNIEYQYGKNEYNVIRAKEHEKKRTVHSIFIIEFTQLKKRIYHKISTYELR
ncbi:hypothetical protein [Patiriisocius marinistellae]|uniref:hypothetical protein n=1 Tax=Patiriisocius marinistellae TaxID=2494560 RepID=UPI001F35F81B|nr:hypothetical protein [Patiriisocius marinistellae]